MIWYFSYSEDAKHEFENCMQIYVLVKSVYIIHVLSGISSFSVFRFFRSLVYFLYKLTISNGIIYKYWELYKINFPGQQKNVWILSLED